MRQIVLLLLFCPFLSLSFAEDGITPDSAMEAYQKGLQSFQNNQFEEARDLFRYSWEKSPQSALSLFNWGLAEQKLGNQGMALAAWRKALFLKPGFDSAEQAIEYLIKTSSLPGIQKNQNHWEVFRESALIKLSFHQLSALVLLLLIAAGWKTIQYLGQRYVAIEQELPLPSMPWVGLFLVTLLISSITLVGFKVVDYYNPRATVIQNTVTVYSAPSGSSSSLFEIYEGAEVYLKRKQSAWSQVKYPGGLTGWVQNQSLFHTSGKEL